MEGLERLRRWLDARRELWLDLLRVYLGFALFAKGISFVRQGNVLFEQLREAGVGFSDGLIAHYVVVAHLCGGLLLGIGLVTRAAAAIQVPVLAGAVLLVHRSEGLFTPQMTLEFTILVLALLVLFTAAGGGPLSVDAWLRKRGTLPTPPQPKTA
jgi:uncharacterized membrane protein YphA (DoxX/SURF4 family)